MAPRKRSFDAMQSSCAGGSQVPNMQNNQRSPGAGNRSVNFSTQAPNRQLNNGTRENDTPTVLISAQLPDNEKLVNTKEFKLTNTDRGKYLACGEKVYVYPERNQFRIRILNMDFNNGSGLRNYVEFSKASLDELIRHASEIERLLNQKLAHRIEVFQHLGLSVCVLPDSQAGRNAIELRSENCFSQMLIATFRNIINFKGEVDREFFVFEAKLAREAEIYRNMLNMFAYLNNENRPNTSGVEAPSETNIRAIINTCNTLWKQIGKIVDKEAKEANNNSR